MVIAETMKLIQDDAVIDAIVAEVMELQDRENTTLPLLEKQMREVENGIENMLNAIQAGVLTNSTKSRLEKLEAQQKELEIRIAEEKIARPRLSENQVRFWLTRLRKLDPNVKSHRETLINTFVNAVYLYDEKVLILNPPHRLILMLCQIVRTGGLDAPLGVAQSFPWNLPFLHRERAVFVKDLVPDTLEILPQMQIRLLVEEVDRLVVLYYGIIFHQNPPSNSRLNLLRPSTSVPSSTVAL